MGGKSSCVLHISALKTFVFKDVFIVSGRCGLTDEDLNRRWKEPDPKLHPSIFHSKVSVARKMFIRPQKLIQISGSHRVLLQSTEQSTDALLRPTWTFKAKKRFLLWLLIRKILVNC